MATGGIPAAVSRLVSASLANGGRGQVRRYLRVGLVVFSSIGIVGTAAMLLWPQFFADLIGDPEIAHCILVLAPAVLFSCVIAVYRGYTQGHSNMIPTAVSQILEVVGKLVIGLSVAWILLRRHAPTHDVAAGAIFGVTVGLAAAVPVLVFYCRKHHRYTDLGAGDPEDMLTPRATAWQMLKVSVPITLSASLASIINVIDTRVIYDRLQLGAHLRFEEAQILYGVYSKGITFFNLPSAIIVPLSVSVVPAIAAAMARNRRGEAREVMESSTRVMNLIAMPACAGMAILAGPIFDVFFPDSHFMGPLLLQVLSLAAYFLCSELVTTSYLQASGYERILLLTSVSGSLIKIALDWILVGRPDVTILGAPVGNVACYGFITAFNFIFLRVKLGENLRFGRMFARPALCTALMGVTAWAVHWLASRLVLRLPVGAHLQALVALVAAVAAAVVVYVVLVVVLKAITREDLMLLPNGEKIADKLKIK